MILKFRILYVLFVCLVVNNDALFFRYFTIAFIRNINIYIKLNKNL